MLLFIMHRVDKIELKIFVQRYKVLKSEHDEVDK